MLYSKNFSVSVMLVIKRQNPCGFCRLKVLIAATRPKIRSRLRLCRAVATDFRAFPPGGFAAGGGANPVTRGLSSVWNGKTQVDFAVPMLAIA
ncbi:MAG: hypothetical protein EOM56_00850 [Deltaproteobacteria bacterium]|nr:hypothetical protein [Deltaproteobacteria bacterium]